MIVDGTILVDILKYETIAFKFFKLGMICRSVICCRVSPKQKSQVVSSAKSFGKWITLSVGDGANDVPMIMEAHIGVGIQGKEGTQAIRSSDYSICQFRFLQRLLLIHGRNGYRRISKFICYYFYKNIILVFAEIYFVFFSGFSGQPFFPDFLPVLYNAIWTSWPCIFAFSIEKDIIDNEDRKHNDRNNLLGKYYQVIPCLYTAGQTKQYFNLKVFWSWLFYAISHGGACYVYVSLGLRYQSVFFDGKLIDHWWLSTVIFTMIIHIVTYKIFVEVNYWNSLLFIASILSILLYYVSIWIIDIPFVAHVVQNELAFKVLNMMSSKVFWVYVTILPVFVIVMDLGIKSIYTFAWPTPIDLVNSNRITMKDNKNIVKKLSQIMDPKEVYASNVSHAKNNSDAFDPHPVNKLNSQPEAEKNKHLFLFEEEKNDGYFTEMVDQK